MSSAIIYTRSGCPHCVTAKRTLEQHGIPYTEHEIGALHTKESIQKKVNDLGHSNVTIKTVPQIFYTDQTGKTTYIGGNSDLQAKKAILGT